MNLHKVNCFFDDLPTPMKVIYFSLFGVITQSILSRKRKNEIQIKKQFARSPGI